MNLDQLIDKFVDRFPVTTIIICVIIVIFGVSGFVGFGIQLLGGWSDWHGWLLGLLGCCYFGIPAGLICDIFIGG